MSEYELKHHICRECRQNKQCADIRGWNVCRECIENIDRQFTSERADYFFVNDKLKSKLAAAMAIIEAARTWFELDEQEAMHLNPKYFKTYHAGKQALAAYDALERDGKGEG